VRGDSRHIAVRESPRTCTSSVARSGDQVEIAPVCFSYFCALVEPSNRVAARCTPPALVLVTNFRPVSVVAGSPARRNSCHR